MDIPNTLAQLRSEREMVEHAIIALERLRGRRRGRPPKWMKEIVEKKPKEKPSAPKTNYALDFDGEGIEVG